MPLSTPSTNTSSGTHTPRTEMLEACLLADDLTGACDAAVAFAARGLVTEVPLSPQARPSSDTEVWARNTNTRDMDTAGLQARLSSELNRLPRSRILFKKIDSAFRGNTFAEIAAALHLRADSLGIVAPAFPALGRTSSGGVVRIADVTGERHVRVTDELRRRGLHLPLLAVGLSRDEITQRLQHHWHQGQMAVYCDAYTQRDLETLIDILQPLHDRVLWIGSGGLAHALAVQRLGASAAAPVSEQTRTPRNGKILFFIGSNHPVTLAQVLALREHADRWQRRTVHILEVLRGVTDAEAIRRCVHTHSAKEIGCLFMTGGDTAALACQALGVDSIRLLREFAPGLPEGIAVGGRFDGVPIILKSGGFGADDVLCRIAQTFDSGAFAAAPVPHEAAASGDSL